MTCRPPIVFFVMLLLALRNSLVAQWIARLMIGVVMTGSAIALGLAAAQPSTAAVGVAQRAARGHQDFPVLQFRHADNPRVARLVSAFQPSGPRK